MSRTSNSALSSHSASSPGTAAGPAPTRKPLSCLHRASTLSGTTPGAGKQSSAEDGGGEGNRRRGRRKRGRPWRREGCRT